MSRRHSFVLVWGIVGAAIGMVARPPEACASATGSIDATCQAASTPIVLVSTTLDTATTAARSGVVFDGTAAQLHLSKAAGYMSMTSLGISDTVFIACSGDFDEDGWPDFVGTDIDGTGYLRVYKNRTYDNAAPDWTDPTKYRTPKFVQPTATVNPTYIVEKSSTTAKGNGSMICGDFNGDGHQDFFIMRCASGTTCTNPARADIFLGNGNGTFKAPYNAVDVSVFNPMKKEGTRFAFVDYNGDGKKDLFVGQYGPGTNSGQVIVLLNDGQASPRFATPVTLLNKLGMTSGVMALIVGDVTNDGVIDLGVGGNDTKSFRIFPGLQGGGFSTTAQTLPGFTGGAITSFAADFSQTGRLDVIIGTDGFGGYPGFNTFYWKNNGTSTPFTSLTNQITSSGHPATDLDNGFMIDYDQDPDHTIDFVIADGNNSANYYLFPNRVVATYVDCGTVASATQDIGSLATQDMTVTDVRITPTPTTTDPSLGTITWDASNDGGTSWHPATACADNANQLCSTFGTTVGKQIRWRANLCSNTINTPHTKTPVITSVATTYTYVTAQNHFRAGPIAQDGIVYVGAFREPGDWGHVYAMSDSTGTTQWDASDALDATAATARHFYTVASDGTPLDFATSNTGDAKLRATLLASSATIAGQIVAWATSARFGLDTMHVLGAVTNSTPALLGTPKQPYWYTLPSTSSFEKTLANVFVNAYTARQQLLLVGAKDGMLHAFYTNPKDANDVKNGHEAWAFVPYDVAQRMLGDKTTGMVTAYPDGSPTLVNAKVYANWRSIVVMPEANGGRSVFALDVTDTIPNGTVVGPTPLWQFSDPAMGSTYSKPTVVRTKVNNAETWMAIFASGPGAAGQGAVVYALDLSSGALLWKFDIGDPTAYVSSDITASETDDEASTSVDGYIDRVFFADNKGRVWKLDPGAAVHGVMDSVDSSVDVGLPHRALFATKVTPGALGVERAIAGTLTAATDASNRLVVYFGTGGTEDTPAGAQNAFYAVYADTGDVRSKLDASTGLAAGVKFYGGVIYQSGQIVFTQGQDLSGLGLCAPTAGSIVAIDANTFATEFVTATDSKIVAPVFAQNGEVYTVTLKGKLMASGFTGSTSTGSAGAAAGAGTGGSPETPATTGPTDIGTTADPFTILSWRQTY